MLARTVTADRLNPSDTGRMNLRKLLFIPPIVLGVVGFLWMTSGRETPGEIPAEVAVAVRTGVITPRPVVARAVGYGRVEAERSWSAVAEIQGRVTTLAEGIAEGSIVEAGMVLIEVNRTDYELSRQKALANIAAADARLTELSRSEENSRLALELQERILEVAKAEFDRVETVVKRGSDSAAALDASRKTLLAQEASVTNLKNTLELYPSQRASAQASLDVRQAELAEAERSLEKASITAPFRGRVSVVNIEEGQFVRTGDTLITLDSTDAVEIIAEVQPRTFQPLVATALGPEFKVVSIIDTSQAVSIMERAQISASVSLAVSESNAQWPAEIVRLRGTMDDETGAMGFVVRVKDPLIASPELGRPPLNVGTFVAVTFSSRPMPGVITVPRDALRYSDQGTTFVYLSDAESRLAIREVQTGAIIGSDIVVQSGLAAGDLLVLSDPRPSVPGLKLEPIMDNSSASGY